MSQPVSFRKNSQLPADLDHLTENRQQLLKTNQEVMDEVTVLQPK